MEYIKMFTERRQTAKLPNINNSAFWWIGRHVLIDRGKAHSCLSNCCLTCSIAKIPSNFFGFSQGTCRTKLTMDKSYYDWSWVYSTVSRKIARLTAISRIGNVMGWVGSFTWGSPVVCTAPPKKGEEIAAIA